MNSQPLRFVTCLILIFGCGSEPDEKFFGTYVLVGVEGHSLPYLDTSDPNCEQFISEGELVLSRDGTYSLEFFGPYDCDLGDGDGPTGNIGRVYNGAVSQAGGELHFQVQVQGAGILNFNGTVNPLEAAVTVPPIPPQTGPDLTLQFAVAP